MKRILAAFVFAVFAGDGAVKAQPLPPAPAGVVVTTSYGIEFSTIGNPGNVPFRDADHVGTPGFVGGGFDNRGSVAYQYRLSRTEVTYSQWLPFVRAFAPHWTGNPDDLRLTGRYIGRDSQGVYQVDPSRVNDPASWMSWPVAAAFTNWLHNRQGTGAAAFLNGAYDLTGMDLTGTVPFTGNLNRQPGALYGLPTVDEWHKAVYYDPNQNGPGLEGWWIHPGSSDVPLISGYLENGGQTSAGQGYQHQLNRPMPVGTYVGVQSPWGLFDGSGGAREFSSETLSNAPTFEATVMGTGRFEDLHYFFDLPGYNLGFQQLYSGMGAGIRLWAAVPAAPSLALPLLALALIRYRSSR